MPSKRVKIVVFVPETHTDKVREAMSSAGAGVIGNYTHCSFSSKGFGRFLPQDGANPHLGSIGKIEVVAEERIEMVCERERLQSALTAMKSAHPYDEIAYDIYALEDVTD